MHTASELNRATKADIERDRKIQLRMNALDAALRHSEQFDVVNRAAKYLKFLETGKS